MQNNPFVKQKQAAPSSEFMLATVDTIPDEYTVTLILDGMTEALQKPYKVLSSAWPLDTGYRVIVMKLSGTYVVIGKIGAADEGGGGGGTYVLPVATDTRLGGIKVGDNLSIDRYGVLSADAEAYELPTATALRLGGIKVGNGLTVQEDGTLAATGGGSSGYTLPPATTGSLGGVIVGSGLSVDSNGVLSASGGSGGEATVVTSDVVSRNTAISLSQIVSSEIAVVGKRASLHVVLKLGDNHSTDSAVDIAGYVNSGYRPAVDSFVIFNYKRESYGSTEGYIWVRKDGEISFRGRCSYNENIEFSIDYFLP